MILKVSLKGIKLIKKLNIVLQIIRLKGITLIKKLNIVLHIIRLKEDIIIIHKTVVYIFTIIPSIMVVTKIIKGISVLKFSKVYTHHTATQIHPKGVDRKLWWSGVTFYILPNTQP